MQSAYLYKGKIMSKELMMTNELINQYCIDHSNTVSGINDEIENYTKANVYSPQMLIGKLESSLLAFLIKSINAKRILEIGTYTGYSALAMATYLPDDGELITLDINKETNEIAQGFWNKSEHGHKIKAHLAPALESIPSLEGQFDIVFIDADKNNYMNYLKLTRDKLSTNGMIIIDNCLWSGNVAKAEAEIAERAQKTTKSIKEVNAFVKQDPELFGTMLPVRDGMFLIRKA